MSELAEKIEEAMEPPHGGHHDGFSNRVALTIAILATFAALTGIQSNNVDQEIQVTQAERIDSWAWYQAVRVREDMASYELSHLERIKRTGNDPEIDADIAAQNSEIAHIRERKDSVEKSAHEAEGKLVGLKARDEQFDLAEALNAVAVSLLAVALLAKARWLYWVALVPGVGALGLGIASMAGMHLPFLAALTGLLHGASAH